jgi:hypothetical protein
MQRYNRQFRPVYGSEGSVIDYAIPAVDSPRYRDAQSGPESGWLHQHDGDNRANRRDRARTYSITGTLPGSNEPYVKEKK